MLLVPLWLAIAAGTPSLEIFVSPEGNDTADGTRERPLRTLPAARDVLRQRRTGANATVWLAPGRFALNETMELTALDSNTTWRGVLPAAPAVVSGGVALAWEVVRAAAAAASSGGGG